MAHDTVAARPPVPGEQLLRGQPVPARNRADRPTGLKDGGRLILPLTAKTNSSEPFNASCPSGAVFRITRRGGDFDADFFSAKCEGVRYETSEQALAVAFGTGGYRDVKRLRRTDDVSEEECWVRAPG